MIGLIFTKLQASASLLFVIIGTFLRSILIFIQKDLMVALMKIIVIITIKCFQKNVHMNNLKMPYYDRINVSEGIDVNTTSASKECTICHRWYFLDKGFKFQPDGWNGCHDVLMMFMNLSDIAILNIHVVDYGCIIMGFQKRNHESITKCLFKQKKWIIMKHNFLFSHIKDGQRSCNAH